MKASILVIPMLTVSIISCGGGGGESDGAVRKGPEDCSVVLSTISLASGDSCNLTQADADLFGLTAGLIECSGDVLTYQGNQFTSGASGISFNGLNFVCGSN